MSTDWRLADAVSPQAFYRGEVITDDPNHQLCQQIRETIRERLHSRVRDLEVEFHDGDVVLSGRCANFHTKQLAQHAALSLLDSTHLENRIEVLCP